MNRPKLQTAGSVAAFANALVGAGALVVAFGLIGPAALADSGQLVDLALHNPLPLLLQDALKFASAAAAGVLVAALFNRLRAAAPAPARLAVVFGLLSILLLLANASLSLFAVTQAMRGSAVGAELNGVIGLLGLAAIMANGVWYLLVCWPALKAGRLPRGLCWLGLAIGGLSLVPLLAILVLVLSVVWGIWLGVALWTAP